MGLEVSVSVAARNTIIKPLRSSLALSSITSVLSFGAGWLLRGRAQLPNTRTPTYKILALQRDTLRG